ncbi:MAG: hypothetical protein GC154_19690 [bacterium]|nr:hypothetical protein [bacterium]
MLILAAVLAFAGTAALFALTRPDSRPRWAALLINNDPSPRHVENMIHAESALRANGIDTIITAGMDYEMANLGEARAAIDRIEKSGADGVVIYITGHGSQLFEREGRRACLMLNDGPFIGDELSDIFVQKAVLAYVDVCFAPDLLDELARIAHGEYWIASDKSKADETKTCRGTSLPFWDAVKRMAGEISLPDAMAEARRETAPEGVCFQSEGWLTRRIAVSSLKR